MRILAAILLIPVSVAVSPGATAADPEGLWSQATLYRDAWGVPHIYAQRVRAMSFAFGYAQAEDHAEAMLLAYRHATGRAAEVLGEAYAASDVFALKAGHGALARTALPKADAVTRDLCEGFALGINAWLTEHAQVLPAWVAPVHPAEVLALWHAYLMSYAPFDLPGAYRPAPASRSGNAWALSPSRSSGKKSLLVINPHQYHDGPYRWYEAHLAVGDYDTAGLTLFGLPVLLQGHNAVLGWALTPNQPDTADIFEERLTRDAGGADLPALYRMLLEKEPLLRYFSRTKTYGVLTPAGLEARSTPAYLTALGPIFESTAGTVPVRSVEARETRRGGVELDISHATAGLGTSGLFVWSAGGYNEFGGLRQLFEMGRAGNLRAFRAALSMQQLPCFHVVYADQAGNLFYLYNAAARAKAVIDPARTGTTNPWGVPIPLELRNAAQGPPVTAGHLPSLTNPGRGYLQACGNPPWHATTDGSIQPGAWPAWFINDADSFRAQYVRRRLMAGKPSFEDMQAMVYDTYASAAADLCPRLLSSVRQGGGAGSLGQWYGVLEGWDYLAEPESTAMTFYAAWWARLTERLGPDAYGALYGNAANAAEAAVTAAAQTAKMLSGAQRNAANLDWGSAQRIRRGDRLEPIFGAEAGAPLFLSSTDAYGTQDGTVRYGFAHAMVVRFGAQPETVSVAIFGASENPDSPHYDDQLDLVLAKRFKPLDYAKEAVLRKAARARGRHVALTPAGVDGAVLVTSSAPVTVALETLTEPPSPLPQDRVAFTLFVSVHLTDGPADTAGTSVSLRVPKVLCAARDLDQLALYAFSEAEGWRLAQGSVFDAGKRSWTAAHEGPGIFAILGPAALLDPEEVVE